MPYLADQNYYLTADKRACVPEGDPRARWLLVAAGCALADAEAARWGLTAPALAAKALDAPPANKAIIMPPANKRGGQR